MKREQIDSLLEAAARAEGSEVLPTVQLGLRYRADEVISGLRSLVLAQADEIAAEVTKEREACAVLAADFMWTLPFYTDDADPNETSDDAACAVQEGIASAIRARRLRDALTETLDDEVAG